VSRDSLTRRLRCPRPALPTTEIPTADPAYIAKVKTAAPEQIVNKASIVMMQRGKPRELQRVSNGFHLSDRARRQTAGRRREGHGMDQVDGRPYPAPDKIGFT
jgi:hypothetical protein